MTLGESSRSGESTTTRPDHTAHWDTRRRSSSRHDWRLPLRQSYAPLRGAKPRHWITRELRQDRTKTGGRSLTILAGVARISTSARRCGSIEWNLIDEKNRQQKLRDGNEEP